MAALAAINARRCFFVFDHEQLASCTSRSILDLTNKEAKKDGLRLSFWASGNQEDKLVHAFLKQGKVGGTPGPVCRSRNAYIIWKRPTT